MSVVGPYRVDASAAFAGSVLDREGAVRFRFDDKPFVGCAGDSLASALLANGVRTIER